LLKRVSTLENSIIEFNRSYSALEMHLKNTQKEVTEYKKLHDDNNNLETKQIVKDLNREFEQPSRNSN